jgi:ribosomal protein L35AE/L33A
MKMKAKRSASNGNRQINGKVVWSDNQSNSRVSTGKLEDGEGVSEVILYLKNDANGEVVNGAVTDLEGNFKMENLTNGEFELLLDIPGLEESATSFELPIDGQIIELSVMVYINDKGIVDFEIITILSNDLAIDQLNLYPNPTLGILYLNGYQGEKQEVSIVSSNGAIVKTIWLRNEQNQEIDLTDLDEGVYYLKSENGNQSMLKIIKKH